MIIALIHTYNTRKEGKEDIAPAIARWSKVKGLFLCFVVFVNHFRPIGVN